MLSDPDRPSVSYLAEKGQADPLLQGQFLPIKGLEVGLNVICLCLLQYEHTGEGTMIVTTGPTATLRWAVSAASVPDP